MSKERITLIFDTEDTTQREVYEYLKNAGRKKSKMVCDALSNTAKTDDLFGQIKDALVELVISDERVKNILSKKNGQLSEETEIPKKRRKKEIKPVVEIDGLDMDFLNSALMGLDGMP